MTTSASTPQPCSNTRSVWGEEQTQFFYELTPERILEAVEASGIEATGRCLALNSMENRVYEVEVYLPEDEIVTSPSDRFRVVKFYRPGRWSMAQILEEHEFLKELTEYELPVVPPIPFPDGSTLRQMESTEIYFAVFPKRGGRIPDEFDNDQLEIIGRLLGRLHNVGAVKPAEHRLKLTPETYGIENLNYLVDSKLLPPQFEAEYRRIVEKICTISSPWFREAPTQRIHGDCHHGNVLWASNGANLVDFDDMVMGPCVQDIWLLVPGRDEFAIEDRKVLLGAYEQMRAFPYGTLRLIEPLRTLRMVHFSAWIGRRWSDPAFPRVFPNYGTEKYWWEELQALREQLEIIEGDQ